MNTIVDTLLLDSKDRESFSSGTTDFTIKFPRPIQDVSHYRFTKVIIPLSMDNVTSSNNTYEINDVSFSVSTGYYTIPSLIDQLNDDHSAAYSFDWTANGRIRMVSDTATNFKFEPLETAKLLGFTSSSYSGDIAYVAEHLPILQSTNYFTLHVEEIANRQKHSIYHSDYRSNILDLIPNTGSHGDVLVYEPTNQIYKYVQDSKITGLHISLRNSANEIVDLQSNNIQIVIERHK